MRAIERNHLLPSQIESAERWLHRSGRLRTSRLRKKFWKNPIRYIRPNITGLMKWYYAPEFFEPHVFGSNPLLQLIPKSEPWMGRPIPVPLNLGK